MTTVIDLISQALKDINVLGVGEVAEADMASDGLALLNQMIGQWQAQKMYTPGEHEVIFSVTGAQTYSIGPGGAVNVPVPVSIDAAFYRQGGIDYQIEVLNSFEDYQAITLKLISGTIPDAIFYQRDLPLGTIYVWPQPSGGEIHLTTRDLLTTYTTLTQNLSVPPEYELAMRYSLAELMMPSYGIVNRPDINGLALRSRKIMKRANLSIPMMGQPPGVVNNGRFSIYTGE